MKSSINMVGVGRQRSLVGRFFHGANMPFRALSFVVGHPSLWLWVGAPAALTATVTLAGGAAVWHWGKQFLDAHAVGHGGFLAVLLTFLLMMLAAGVAYVLFLGVSMVATAPFSGFISERTEKLATGELVAPRGFGSNVVSSVRSTAHTVVALILYFSIAAGLLLVHWLVTPLAPVTWVLGGLETAVFLAYDAWDLPLSRRDASFFGKWRTLGRHGAESLGLGATAAILFAVPGLGVLVAPLVAVAGTLLFAELERP